MAFATGEDVMRTVEALVSELPAALNSRFIMAKHKNGINGHFHPVSRSSPKPSKDEEPQLPWPEFPTPFPRITYEEAMGRYGSDKPDLRIPFDIRRVDHALPRHFIAKIVGDVKDPVIEAFRFRPDFGSGTIPRSEVVDSVRGLIAGVMKTLPEALAKNPVGQPAPLLVNSEQPMKGLSSLGFDGYLSLMSGEPGLEDFVDLQDGDVLVFQARENKPFSGGSTPIGLLRTLFYQAALEQGLLPRSFDFKFLWVRDFPMFTPNNRDDPGQGGKSGFSATHHPFTAPLTDADVELLATDPLKARADHYDLVVNGIELGGGSRRIHLAAMQEYIMRDILKMPHGLPLKGVEQFRHLLEALRAGCPPHAGFALGFDRLCAVLTGTDSVRDVIAFPKNMKGADVLVKSPSAVSPEQLEVYHLRYTAIPLPGQQHEQEES
jgi:aspartyl-tRNA synthetase